MLTKIVLALVLVAAQADLASAHTGPDIDSNNRYLKLTPMADRVRLVYVIYFGERPGAQARQRIDRDGDGHISPIERDAFGATLSSAVATNLRIDADGQNLAVTWSNVHVGLGSKSTHAGSFSIDMVAWLCLDERPQHRLSLRDRYRLPHPGETELRIEPSPTVILEQAAQDPNVAITRSLRWQEEAAPLATQALILAFAEVPPTDSRTARKKHPSCRSPEAIEAQTDSNGMRRYLLALILIGLFVLAWLIRKGRHPQSS